MANTHIQPDHAAEIQAQLADVLSPAILASSWAVPVPPSMTFAPFETYAYVNVGAPPRLTYVHQPAVSLALAGGDGLYWLAVHADTHTPVSGWTRRIGSHYLWRAAAAQPVEPQGGLVALKITVAGGAITALDNSPAYPGTRVAVGGVRGQLTYPPNLTWNGTTLTVRTHVNARQFLVEDHAGDNLVAFHTTAQAAGGTNRWAIFAGGDAPSRLTGTLTVLGAVGLGIAPAANYSLTTLTSTQLAANVTIGMVGTAATYMLDVNGNVRARNGFLADTTAHVGQYLSAGGAPDARFSLRSYGESYFDGAVGIGSQAGHKLNVGGNAYITNAIGVGTAPDVSWSVAAVSVLAHGAMQMGSYYCIGNGTVAGNFNTNAISATGLSVSGNCQLGLSGFGYAPVGGYWIRAGRTWVDDLSIGGANSGWTLLVNGTMHVTSTTNVAGRVDMTSDCRVHSSLAVGGIEPGAEGYGFHCAPLAKFRASIQVDGNASKPGGGAWTDSNSMQRYKTNIRPLRDALPQLLALQGSEWEWSPDYPELEALLPGTRTGFVIEDVEQARPQWVSEGPQETPGSKALAISGFEALTVEAIREIVTRLEALERTR